MVPSQWQELKNVAEWIKKVSDNRHLMLALGPDGISCPIPAVTLLAQHVWLLDSLPHQTCQQPEGSNLCVLLTHVPPVPSTEQHSICVNIC